MKKIMMFVGVLALSMLVTACDVPSHQPTAEQRQTQQTKALMDDAEQRVGMPRVTNFTEKRLANQIMELRDQPNLATYTYTVDMQGKSHCLGRSIGFGLPYTTQITNPMQLKDTTDQFGNGWAIWPQAEPNGLYSSDSTDATWVLLVGADGKPKPAYIESQVTVTLEPLRTAADPC